MKMLISLVVLLCVADVINGAAAVNEACVANTTPCNADLTCENAKCKANVDKTCTEGSSDECVKGATCSGTGANAKCTCPAATTTAKADKTQCLMHVDQACEAVGDCVANTACTERVCKCATNYSPKSDKSQCLKNVDQGCGNADECVENTECVGSTTLCKCKVDYTPKSDKSQCQANIDKTCTEGSSDECVKGATCTGTGANAKCTCPAGTTPEAKTQCLMHVGQKCGDATDCVANTDCTGTKCACKKDNLAIFGNAECRKAPGQTCATAGECGENADCPGTTDKKCTCKSGFDSKAGQRCGMKVDGECSVSKDCVTNAECKKAKTSDAKGKCACMTDYTDDGSKFCKKSSGASAVASVMLVLAAFVTSRWI